MAHSKPIPPLSLTIQGYGTRGWPGCPTAWRFSSPAP